MNKKKAKLKKEILQPIIDSYKMLPIRPGRSYTANMDNVIFEANFKEGGEKDEAGKFIPAHAREVDVNKILSVGPLVNIALLKKGTLIVPESRGSVLILEMDEFGYIASVKPHYITAVIDQEKKK